MATVRSGDRCADCKHCKVWKSDHRKATCTLYNEQGFHPDRPVPVKCVDKVNKTYQRHKGRAPNKGVLMLLRRKIYLRPRLNWDKEFAKQREKNKMAKDINFFYENKTLYRGHGFTQC